MFELITDELVDLAGLEYRQARVEVDNAYAEGRITQFERDLLVQAVWNAQTSDDSAAAMAILRWARDRQNESGPQPIVGSGSAGGRAPGAKQTASEFIQDVKRGTSAAVDAVTPWWVAPLIVVGVLYGIHRVTTTPYNKRK